MGYIHSGLSWFDRMGVYAPKKTWSSELVQLCSKLDAEEDKLDDLMTAWLNSPYDNRLNGKNELYELIRQQRKVVSQASMEFTIKDVEVNEDHYKYMVSKGVLKPFHYIPGMVEWEGTV